jgi:threonine dehydrogenase-like Zn-dependent dehydrogenase
MSITETMLAVQLVRPETCRVVEVSKPIPATNQIRIRLEGCGLCASSLPLWEGREWFKYPIDPGTPGHEGWGVVDAVGQDVQDFSCGDRVAFLSNHAFAEYDLACGSQVVRLPLQLKTQPFPGEAIGCALNIFQRSDIRVNQTVAIVGAGFLGLLLIHLSVSAGARVIAISRRDYALKMAQRFGAAYVIPIDRNPVEKVSQLTDGGNCDRVIEAVGLQSSLDIASDLVSEGGKLIIAGYHQDGYRVVNLQQWNWRGIDVINAHERDPRRYISGIEAAVKASICGTLEYTLALTHEFSIHQANDAFRLLQTRPDGFIKGYISL